MDLEALVRRAKGGDVKAFVDLTRRFQHFAFGSALALVHDFQQAEDVVQEAFVAAWAGLPGLAEPAAFPGWLRGIVRNHASRVHRRRRVRELPLVEADAVASDEPAPDHQVDQRLQANAVLAALAELPASLREPATLFYVHECSHQDIAVFLGLAVATVNNRLHAARTQLRQRMLTMLKDTLHTHGLPDDFANRIGRLVEMRGGVVEALFDPAAMPDILAELAISDEANQRAINVHVVQRAAGGLVRSVAISAVDTLPRGATVLSSGRHTVTPVSGLAIDRLVPLLAGPSPVTTGAVKLVETGIKVIDVMCPVVAGGSLAIAGVGGVGITVVMEELVRRLGGGADPVSMFVMMPPPSEEWAGSLDEGYSHAEAFKKEGYSEGTLGAVQTFFFRSEEGPWTEQRLAALAPVDTVIHLSRARTGAKIYPGVDVLTSRSRALEAGAVDDAHAAIATRVRQALTTLWACDGYANADIDDVALQRARKLQNFFAQPFFVAEPFTRRPGSFVSRAEALRGCREILDGQHDNLPVGAFYFAGTLEEVRATAGKY